MNNPRFNSAKVIQASALLSKTQHDSILIAKRPEEFLRRSGRLASFGGDTSAINDFIQGVEDDSYRRKLKLLEERRNLTKKRTLFLGLSSVTFRTPVRSPNDLISITNNGGSSNSTNSTLGNEEEVQSWVEECIKEIRSADTNDIEAWLKAGFEINSFQLPVGLPPDLEPLGAHKKNECQKHSTFRGFTESSLDQFLLLDGEYHSKVENLLRVLKDNQKELLTPPWSLKEAALLCHTISILPSNGDNVLPDLFPDKSGQELLREKYLLRRKRVLEDKLTNLLRDWVRDKDQLTRNVNKAFMEVAKSLTEALIRKDAHQKQKDLCEYWARVVEDKRKQRAEKMLHFRVQTEPFYRKRDAEARERAKREDDRLKRLKDNVRRFKEEEKQLRVAAEATKTNEVKETRSSVILNRSRVQFRRSAHQSKLKSEEDKRSAALKARELQAKALEKSKEPVQVPLDPVRIYSDTHTSKVRRYATLMRSAQEREEVEVVRFFREKYSFSDEKVAGDRRVRLEIKLREAGLLESTYARQVLLALEPKAKPHMDSEQIKSSLDLSTDSSKY